MNNETPTLSTDDGLVPEFTPVAMTRNRHDDWTPERQRMFVKALGVTGTVEAAARMVRMSRKSAYALRDRSDAKEFAEAWDIAISTGRARIFDYMFDRAVNGVTTITLKMGGAIDISHRKDSRLVTAQLRSPLPGQNTFSRTKGA